MDLIKTQRALGLMSSSSLDGVKAAVVSTDGVDVFEQGPFLNVPYDEVLRERLRSLYYKTDSAEYTDLFAQVERELTEFHAEVVRDIVDSYDEKIDVIGFHGHTVFYDPPTHRILQIGDGPLLSELTGIKVVNRFRVADVAAGGQGAPLSPLYHQALSVEQPKPLAILNIGGISSVTWLGINGEIMAFDTGPGNVPINDWVLKHGGQHMDYNGKLAITGTIDGHVLASLMRHKYLGLYPPKAVDRNAFNDKLEHLEGLSLADGAATVTAFIAETIAYSLALYLPEMPPVIIVCGGGAKNPTLLRFLRQRLENVELKSASELGWNPEAVEAQAFAYLAVRRCSLMPGSFPATTGAAEPVVLGEICEAVH